MLLVFWRRQLATHAGIQLVVLLQYRNVMAVSRKTSKKSARSKRKPAKKQSGKPARKWSAKVNERSDALDLESKTFKSKDPVRVARSLKRSSDRSKRRKGTPLQSAMSMLNFYINRAGKKLPAKDKKVLEEAKDELRALYGRERKDE